MQKRRIILGVALGLCFLSVTALVLLNRSPAPPAAAEPDPMENPVLNQLASSFDTTANISYKGLDAVATIKQEYPRSCEVAFTSPESLKDMAFTFGQDSVGVTYRGLSFAFDPSSVPGDAAARLMVSAINAAMRREGVTLSLAEGALTVEGSAGGSDFALTLDPETGHLLKLFIPDQQLEIEFSNFTFSG